MSETQFDYKIKDESSLTFNKWGHLFEGAFSKSKYLKTEPGIYVIWCRSGFVWTLLDVGEAENIKEHIDNHEHTLLWIRKCSELSGKLYYSAKYVPESTQFDSINIVETIKMMTPPVCG